MSYDLNELDLRRVDLNLLLVFTAIMRTGSVQAAADRLYLGPSAVSMALGRLRRHFGEPLLVRTPAGMEPTAFAFDLHARIAPALGEIGHAVLSPLAFDPAGARRTIRFASSDDLEIVLLPRLLSRLQREAPGIDLIVRSSDLRVVPDQLDKSEVDLGLGSMPPRLAAHHRYEVLYTDGFVVLCEPDSLGSTLPLTPADYAALPHALVSPAGAQHGIVDDAMSAVGLSRRVVATVPRFSTLPFLLKGARLIAAMPAVPAAHYARAFRLACLDLPVPSPRFDVALVWHARAERDPAQAWFRKLVREEVAAISADEGPEDGRSGAVKAGMRFL